MRTVASWMGNHIFWSTIIFIIAVSFIVDIVAGTNIARVAGQFVTLMLVIKLIIWLLCRKGEKKEAREAETQK